MLFFSPFPHVQASVYLVLLLSLISLQKHLINLTHYPSSYSFSYTGFIAQLMTCKWLNHTLLNKCQLHFFTMCMCGEGRMCQVS